MRMFPDCAKCRPNHICDQHANPNYVLRDGERMSVRIPLQFMDSMQRDIAANAPDAIRAQARADHEAWKLQEQSQVRDSADPCDSWERAYHDQAVASNAAAGQRAIAALSERAKRVQGFVDHHAEVAHAVTATRPQDKAYSAMCDSLNFGAHSLAPMA